METSSVSSGQPFSGLPDTLMGLMKPMLTPRGQLSDGKRKIDREPEEFTQAKRPSFVEYKDNDETETDMQVISENDSQGCHR